MEEKMFSLESYLTGSFPKLKNLKIYTCSHCNVYYWKTYEQIICVSIYMLVIMYVNNVGRASVRGQLRREEMRHCKSHFSRLTLSVWAVPQRLFILILTVVSVNDILKKSSVLGDSVGTSSCTTKSGRFQS